MFNTKICIYIYIYMYICIAATAAAGRVTAKRGGANTCLE